MKFAYDKPEYNYDPFYTLQTDNLRPSQDVLKECVNGEH